MWAWGKESRVNWINLTYVLKHLLKINIRIVQLFCPRLVQWTRLPWIVRFGLAPAEDVVKLSALTQSPMDWVKRSQEKIWLDCFQTTHIRVPALGSCRLFPSKVLLGWSVIPLLLATECPRKGTHVSPQTHPTQWPHPTVARWLWDSLQAAEMDWKPFKQRPTLEVISGKVLWLLGCYIIKKVTTVLLWVCLSLSIKVWTPASPDMIV